MQTAELLTMKEAAAVLNVTRPTLYKLARKGQLRLVKLAGATRVPRTEIDRIIRGE